MPYSNTSYNRTSSKHCILWYSKALSCCSDLMLWQSFQPVAMQLSKKAGISLAKILVTASCHSSNTRPRMTMTIVGLRWNYELRKDTFCFASVLWISWVKDYHKESMSVLLVQMLKYAGITMSIPRLMMPWLHVSPKYQQPWHWLRRTMQNGS